MFCFGGRLPLIFCNDLHRAILVLDGIEVMNGYRGNHTASPPQF